jgi:hypothetical protein
VWVDGLEKGAYSVSDSFAREKPVKRPRTDAGPGKSHGIQEMEVPESDDVSP